MAAEPQSSEREFARGSFLARLSGEDLEDLLRRGRVHFLPRGTTVETENEVPARIILLLSGAIKLCHYASDGREVILSLVGAGDICGQPLPGLPQPAAASAITLTEVEVLSLPCPEAAKFLDSNPRARDVFIATMMAQLRTALDERIETVMNDTTGRLARRIITLATRFGTEEGGVIHIRLLLTQQELASWTGASREAVSRSLQQMRMRGWLQVRRREIVVLDMARLRQRVYFGCAAAGTRFPPQRLRAAGQLPHQRLSS